MGRTFPADGKQVKHAIWLRGDRYVVQRIDATEILPFRTRNANEEINDTHPR
ncbi:hypothetical protein [Streptomyces sp. NPDC050856]|uniref:hypothetical protein n=1 Tax=Streptomyces sp. NPDC050856 TaxID=3154939 RepID=UPI0033F375F1